MSLTPKDVKKTAHLARLSFSDDRIESITNDLAQILKLVEKMKRANTNNIEPLAHPLDGHEHLRPDQITEANQRELFQSIAPKVSAGLYIVPKVIETE
jgi:aspartyl-tRNA(Asn)/glutamyl-tRNA(Gln) amidotransferase subunit C